MRFVDVPESAFLAITGTEAPGSEGFAAAIRALYGAGYRLHFALKARGVSSRVGMLEALYWLPRERLLADEPTDRGPENDRWRWRLLLGVPREAAVDEVDAAIQQAEPEMFRDRLYLGRWAEGPSAQNLHVGSYAAESPTLRRLHDAIDEAGLRPHGAHHEIYLNDPRRVGEERTKTVLRQPVAAA